MLSLRFHLIFNFKVLAQAEATGNIVFFAIRTPAEAYAYWQINHKNLAQKSLFALKLRFCEASSSLSNVEESNEGKFSIKLV